MAKKSDSFYFGNFYACADCAYQAAHLLERVMRDFDPLLIREKLDDMHKVEHAADEKKHEVLDALVKAFITPIEREDILQLSQNLDDLTDKLEDVFIRLYYNRVTAIRPDALEMADIVIRCCQEVGKLMNEFADFKRSKLIHDHIVSINTLEESADKLFIDCMYRLHDTCKDPLEVIAWREIYIYLEKCADTCEHIADMVESVIMKNS